MAKGRKTGGRKRGTLNKVTTDVRAAIAATAIAKADEIGKWLDEVKDPARRLELFLRMLEYHVPKLSRSEGNDENRSSVVIEIYKTAPTQDSEPTI